MTNTITVTISYDGDHCEITPADVQHALRVTFANVLGKTVSVVKAPDVALLERALASVGFVRKAGV